MRAGSTQNHAKKGVFFSMVQKKSTNNTNNVEKSILVQKSVSENFRFGKILIYVCVFESWVF